MKLTFRFLLVPASFDWYRRAKGKKRDWWAVTAALNWTEILVIFHYYEAVNEMLEDIKILFASHFKVFSITIKYVK